jgi:hypothetical protein
MARKARIDAQGAMHHIIIRGIERRSIFRDDPDREWFLTTLGVVLTDSKRESRAAVQARKLQDRRVLF